MPEQKKTYDIDLHFEKDHVWAQVKELPGCFATGRDLEELADALTEALNMCLGDGEVASVRIEPAEAVKPIAARVELVAC